MKPNKSGVATCHKSRLLPAIVLALAWALGAIAAVAQEAAPPSAEPPLADRIAPGMRAVALPIEPVWAELLEPGDEADIIVNLTILAPIENSQSIRAYDPIPIMHDVYEPMSTYLVQKAKILSFSVGPEKDEATALVECTKDEAAVLAFSVYSVDLEENPKPSIKFLPRNPSDKTLLPKVQVCRFESLVDLANLESQFQRSAQFMKDQAEQAFSRDAPGKPFTSTIQPGGRAIALPMERAWGQTLKAGDFVDILINLYISAPIENQSHCFGPPPKTIYVEVKEPMTIYALQKRRINRITVNSLGLYSAIMECSPEEALTLTFAEYAAGADLQVKPAITFIGRPNDDSILEKVSVTRFESLVDLANLESLFRRSVNERLIPKMTPEPAL
jgi:Flp pilus assembly protein CpaB